MSDPLSQGEHIRKAIKWISENLKEDPEQSVKKLINEAILRFDLSPGDSEFLMNFYREEKKG
jgi:hypothetical protein